MSTQSVEPTNMMILNATRQLPYLLTDDDLLFDVLELTLYRDLWRGISDTVAPSGSRYKLRVLRRRKGLPFFVDKSSSCNVTLSFTPACHSNHTQTHTDKRDVYLLQQVGCMQQII